MDLSNLYKRINVKVGSNCQISDFCGLENVVIGNNVQIADGAQLKNAVIGDNTKLGRNVTLYTGNADKPVCVGRDCWLSYGVFAEGTQGRILFDDYSIIAHRTVLLSSSGAGAKNPVMHAIYPESGGDITIGKYSWIGAQCTILPNVFFEEGIVVGANSLVRPGRYQAWSVYGGTPAKLLKTIEPELVARALARLSNGR